MANLYNSFRHCRVHDLGNGVWQATSAINDSFHEMNVTVTVRREAGYKLTETGGYVIERAEGEMLRSPLPMCQDTLSLLDALKGLELHPPVRKKVMEAVAGNTGCRQLADLVLECIRGFIQAEFTYRGRDFTDPLEMRQMFKKDIGGTCYLYSNV